MIGQDLSPSSALLHEPLLSEFENSWIKMLLSLDFNGMNQRKEEIKLIICVRHLISKQEAFFVN